MVKIWVVSDLHTNVAPWLPQVPEHDLLLVAGDVADGPSAVATELASIRDLTKKPVIFVPGNHDFLGGTLRAGQFAQLDRELVVLEGGGSKIFGGVRVVGATLWTDFELTETEFAAQRWAISAMPEYSGVHRDNDHDFIRPIDVANAHESDLAGLEQSLATHFDGPTIVVTHHGPSIRSVPAADRGDPSSAAFASDLESVILQYQPDLWIHGHIHEPVDYMLGSTRVISNARGYPERFERSGTWLEDLVIEVPLGNQRNA